MPAPGPESLAELAIRATTTDSGRASAWLNSVAQAHGVPPQQIVRLDHCLDEAFANVIRHGGPGALTSPVRVQLVVRRRRADCMAELSVVDAGVAFDPSMLNLDARPRPSSLADVEPGGLGLLIIRHFSDGLSYCRREDCNHLTMTVSWTEEA